MRIEYFGEILKKRKEQRGLPLGKESYSGEEKGKWENWIFMEKNAFEVSNGFTGSSRIFYPESCSIYYSSSGTWDHKTELSFWKIIFEDYNYYGNTWKGSKALREHMLLRGLYKMVEKMSPWKKKNWAEERSLNQSFLERMRKNIKEEKSKILWNQIEKNWQGSFWDLHCFIDFKDYCDGWEGIEEIRTEIRNGAGIESQDGGFCIWLGGCFYFCDLNDSGSCFFMEKEYSSLEEAKSAAKKIIDLWNNENWKYSTRQFLERIDREMYSKTEIKEKKFKAWKIDEETIGFSYDGLSWNWKCGNEGAWGVTRLIDFFNIINSQKKPFWNDLNCLILSMSEMLNVRGRNEAGGKEFSFFWDQIGENEFEKALNKHFKDTATTPWQFRNFCFCKEWDGMREMEEFRKKLRKLVWLYFPTKTDLFKDAYIEIDNLSFRFMSHSDEDALFSFGNFCGSKEELKSFAEFLKDRGEEFFKDASTYDIMNRLILEWKGEGKGEGEKLLQTTLSSVAERIFQNKLKSVYSLFGGIGGGEEEKVILKEEIKKNELGF